MKHIFTLIAIALFAFNANAQFSQNFENYSALSANCWELTATKNVTATNLIINGAASIGTDPTVASEISTPYLAITGTSNVSFKYRINNRLNQNSTRTVEIGTTDKNGTFTAASSFVLDKNTNQNSVFTFNQNLALGSGTKRFTIRVTTKSGDGNSYVIIDDLSVTSASLHYGANPCNSAPVATNADFFAFGYAPYNGDIRGYASDANAGEVLTFSLVTAPTVSGSFVLNPNGTFTFTPSGGFTGGTVTFTYSVTDNGYDPLSSNMATVTITYPSQTPLPVSVTNFSGNVSGNRANLSWTVLQNEDGNYFQVEKSNDGKSFSVVAMVMNSAAKGVESYTYSDVTFSKVAYYRLKVVNKNTAFFYSKTITLKEAAEAKANSLVILQNPVTTSINYAYNAGTNGTGVINLYTTTGIKVFTGKVSIRKGTNSALLNLDNKIVPGAYIIEIVNGTERGVARFIKQ